MIIGLVFSSGKALAQTNHFDKVAFLIGEWNGSGSGFGNEKSSIESSFQFVMNSSYIEVINDSKFEPSEKRPEGEHHIDKGFISFDNDRGKIVFRQFNIEGFVNQYTLNESLSSDSVLIFETEIIENLPGGKARWTIRRVTETEIETIFDVSFKDDEYTCFGSNYLKKK